MSALREGYTTGSCAAAAAKAAAIFLAEGRAVESVDIPLPGAGGRLTLPVVYARSAGGGAEAAVVKDAGDDPDVTNGALVLARVSWSAGENVQFAAGDGVGTVTRPGLAIPPGEPAINPVPRWMITAALAEVTPRGLKVTVSIAGGAELARRTFNPRIGVLGGLSILGTTGIVRPFSCSALAETIRCSLGVAAAAGIRAPVLVPGHIGERAARGHFRISEEQVVEVGNLWGIALDEVLRRPFAALMAAGHPGKLAKLSAGDWDTHSGRSASAVPPVRALYERLFGRPLQEAATVEGIFTALEGKERGELGDALAESVRKAVAERTGGRLHTAAVLIDLKGRILGRAGDLTPWQ